MIDLNATFIEQLAKAYETWSMDSHANRTRAGNLTQEGRVALDAMKAAYLSGRESLRRVK